MKTGQPDHQPSAAPITPMTLGKNQFGTFGGVFTPAILTILGVIMFMRANFVVGQAGIIGALLILLIAKSITFTTSLSISAISTNMPVRGGGAYFLISRVLGAEFGGAIGIALYFALALSVPFYILGFAEALIRSLPELAPHFQAITLGAAIILFTLAYVGAGWAIKTQYLIMSFLFLAIFAFLGGAIQHFSTATFAANLAPGFTAISPDSPQGADYSFWIIFAIYFPAVTGIDAGLNMSGDLKNPARAIPHGTLAAVGLGFTIYLIQIILVGGAYPRETLIATPYELLKDNALFGLSFFVTLGVIAATLSSALGSYLGGPRVLQAVARDRLLGPFSYFAKGTAKGDEPRRALLLTFAMTLMVLLWAGNSTGGGALNVMAAIITMFFLYSYGMINLSAFIEDFGGNPSFRPQFRFFHWATALAGFLGSLAVALLINWLAAAIAVILIALFLWHLKTRHLKAKFGDARRGFIFHSTRTNLLRLERMEESPKNWRPTLLIFSGNPSEREILVTYASWLEAKRGLVYLAYILVGDFDDLVSRRTGALLQLSKYCEDKSIEAFPTVVVSPSVDEGINMLLQAATIGPIRPNLAVFGWSRDPERFDGYIRQLLVSTALKINLVLINAAKLPAPEESRRIDVWWRGKKNGALMLMLAHLLTENWEWHDAEIRLLRVVPEEVGRQPAEDALRAMLQKARVAAVSHVIASQRPFVEILQEESTRTACTIIGLELPESETDYAWYQRYEMMISKVPATILVHSVEEQYLLV